MKTKKLKPIKTKTEKSDKNNEKGKITVKIAKKQTMLLDYLCLSESFKESEDARFNHNFGLRHVE